MNILIFSKENDACIQLIQQAITSGHYVTWYTDSANQLHFENKNLYIIAGDVMNYTMVEEAMQGQEIVIDAMHATSKNPKAFYATATTNILKAMAGNQVSRLILLSRYGVNSNLKQAPFLYQVWFRVLHWFEVASITRLALVENYVRNSMVQWTIVRPVVVVKNSSKEATAYNIYQQDVPIKRSVLRANSLASFMLTIAVKGSFIQEIVAISSK